MHRHVIFFALTITLWAWATISPAKMVDQVGKAATTSKLATITTQNGAKISAEIADTPAKRSKGLMYRTHMPLDHGMIFIFRKSERHIFWMKNTKMPLDIIWLDSDHKVVHIEHNVPICTRTDEGCPRYRSNKDAQYVLELGSGGAIHYDITVGSQLTITMP